MKSAVRWNRAVAFPNTEDGYKLLFADGIFCEVAVFEPDELEAVPFANGRIVWKRPSVASAVQASAADFPPHNGQNVHLSRDNLRPG